MSIYVPSEGSFMLQIEVKAYAKGKVLDMGTGTGVQTITAASNKGVKSVLAVDKSKRSISHCKKKIKNSKIRFKESNLFSNVKGRFDTIIFNPPYLPSDGNKKDSALIGGKKGHETIEMFLAKAAEYLENEGIILLLFSSLTNKEKVDEIITRNCFDYEKLQEKGMGLMERLYVYKITKSKLLVNLNKSGVKNVRQFAKGKRGVIYKGEYKKKKVAIKTQRKDVEVKTIQNEIECLKKLQKKNIGPKIVHAEESFFVYEFIEGKFIEEFVEKHKSKKRIKGIILNVMMQCRQLDKMGLNKEEMHHPYKHVIITKDCKAVLVDFERCRNTQDPKNVSQFCQYLTHGRMAHLLEDKGISINEKEMRKAAKQYKKKFDENGFEKIIDILK